jgi:hypothetical protein
MKNVIVVFEKQDIPQALYLLAQNADAEIWVFDPHLIDDLKLAGVGNCQFIPVVFDLEHLSLINEAKTIAIEKRIEFELEQAIPEAIGCHWQYLNLFYQVVTIHSYSILFEKLLLNLSDIKFHILIRDVPAQFYALSFWPSMLLLERLNTLQRPFAAYSYGRFDEVNQLIPAGENFSTKEGPYQAFVHLPTCIYDGPYFAEEINAVLTKALNFQSMNWDVPFPSLHTVGLCLASVALARLPAPEQAAVTRTTAAIQEILADFFNSHLKTEGFAIRQAAYLAKQVEAQMIFYYSLVQEFAVQPPQKMILSNHDSGHHGPLTSFARKFNIPVILLPHAKVFNWPVNFAYSNTVALTHPVQGGVIKDFNGKRVTTRLVSFPERHVNNATPVSALKSIGLVLNKFSNDGFNLIDTQVYCRGLRNILAWCKDHDIACKTRVKPAGTCITWLVEEVGFDRADLEDNARGTIADFATGCDICLMYDCPTSGAIDLMRNSIPTVNTVSRFLDPTEAAIVDASLVPRESVAETLQRLNAYRNNPSELFIFRTRQFACYAGSFAESLPLRALL